ncbi:MAG: F510_1955 family glycosylhydrolase, partial [Acidimicrobiia bacterium]
PARTRSRALLAVGALSVVALSALAAFAAAQFRDGDPGATGEAAIAHVHGLGVNPADNDLYVATHYGVFRVGADQTARRVGEGAQDTMGFTVAGPDRFLASGHPDVAGFRNGQPTRLGLIESTDAARTWRSRSLSGDVDFHALGFAHDRVYGWDSTSGQFMVSSDARTWETRSREALSAFAVDPDDAEHIVAAGAEGAIDSTDGGRTWTAQGGPVLRVVSWDGKAGLFGVAADGAVYHSTDGGDTWGRSGRLDGQAQALLARPDALYAATADEQGTTGIYRSTDQGQTWRLYYQEKSSAGGSH